MWRENKYWEKKTTPADLETFLFKKKQCDAALSLSLRSIQYEKCYFYKQSIQFKKILSL